MNLQQCTYTHTESRNVVGGHSKMRHRDKDRRELELGEEWHLEVGKMRGVQYCILIVCNNKYVETWELPTKEKEQK